MYVLFSTERGSLISSSSNSDQACPSIRDLPPPYTPTANYFSRLPVENQNNLTQNHDLRLNNQRSDTINQLPTISPLFHFASVSVPASTSLSPRTTLPDFAGRPSAHSSISINPSCSDITQTSSIINQPSTDRNFSYVSRMLDSATTNTTSCCNQLQAATDRSVYSFSPNFSISKPNTSGSKHIPRSKHIANIHRSVMRPANQQQTDTTNIPGSKDQNISSDVFVIQTPGIIDR